MTVEEATEAPPPPPFETLSILRLVKEAQQKHGLRHGDYMAYRSYCARRLRRLRKALKFTHQYRCVSKHRGKFSAKTVVVDVLNDERFLELAVFEVERNWAYAMQLKFEAGEDQFSRKKFHLRQKLRKAVKHSENLEQVAKQSPRVDTTTKLEAQAYNAFVKATLALELKEWSDALELYRTVEKIYKNLSGVFKNSEVVDLYVARCKEVQNTLKLCEYNVGQQTNVSEMLRMKLEGTEDLSMEFDKLLSEVQTKGGETEAKTVRWSGQSVAVTNPKVKQILEASAQLDQHLKQTDSGEGRIALYEKFLGDIRDVTQKYGEEHRKTAVDVVEDDALPTWQVTLTYLDFVRLRRANERYLQLLENTRNATDKKTKPQDFLRLYEQIVENCNEILELPRASADQPVQLAFQFKAEFYKAFKCYYMAEAYAVISKWPEASALYKRAAERAGRSEKLHKSAKNNEYIAETAEDLQQLQSLIKRGEMAATASRISETAGADEEETTEYDAPLLEQLNEWRRIDADKLKSGDGIALVRSPPALQPMPCKPLFFDIALNHLRLPDANERIAQLLQEEEEKKKKLAEAAAAAPAKKAAGKKGGAAAQRQQQQQPPQEEQGGSGIGGLVKGFFWGKK